MAYTTRIWLCTSGLRRGARVEERFINTLGHTYTFIQNDGKANEANYPEAMRKVKTYGMELVFDTNDYEED